MAKHQTIRGAKIEQRNGSYTVKLYSHTDEQGKRHYKRFTAPDRQQLMKAANEWLNKKDGYKPSQITLGQAIDEYISTCESSGHSPSTISGYMVHRRNGYPAIINLKLSDITVIDIQRQINARAKGHSPKTVSNEYGLLHIVLKTYRPDLDLSTIRLPSARNKASIADTTVIPSRDDINALLAAAQSTDTPLFLAILLASQLGLRRSELCALQWSDITGTQISITKAIVKHKDRSLITKAPKSREGRRTLSIGETLAAILQAYRKPSGPVIEMTPNNITQHFQRLRDRLGITGRFHDLRAYHASTLVALQAPPEYIMADMGHSTMDLYRRIYTHMQTQAKATMYESLHARSNSDIADFFGRISVASDVKNATNDVQHFIQDDTSNKHESQAIPNKKPDT